MTEADIIQIQNEIFTTLVIEELTNQRNAGKKKGEFLLDKYEIDKIAAERLKRHLASERK